MLSSLLGGSSYLVVGFIGFLIGVILTCILLSKKNFETYQRITKEVNQNYEVAKAVADRKYNNFDEDEEDDEEE